jgi:hypothetical protein
LFAFNELYRPSLIRVERRIQTLLWPKLSGSWLSAVSSRPDIRSDQTAHIGTPRKMIVSQSGARAPGQIKLTAAEIV